MRYLLVGIAVGWICFWMGGYFAAESSSAECRAKLQQTEREKASLLRDRTVLEDAAARSLLDLIETEWAKRDAEKARAAP